MVSPGLIAALAGTALMLVACGAPAADDDAPPATQDAADLIQRALAAREADDLDEFADLVSAAASSCQDLAASGRLGEVAVIAGRWSAAVLEGRPKQQAVTEAQLAEVDWAALATACSG